MSKPLFLKDSNIEANEIDAFGVHSKIAKSIAEIIKQVDINNSAFTLGLFGHWGSGKSFIIKELVNIIENSRESIQVFTIDVWKFVDQPLLRSILFQLSEYLPKEEKEKYINSLQEKLYASKTISKLEKRDWKDQLKDIWKGVDYGSVLISAALLIILLIVIFVIGNIIETNHSSFDTVCTMYKIILPLLGYLIAFIAKPFNILLNGVNIANYSLAANFSPEQFEELFEEFVKKYVKKQKAIIIFDNIDRCSSQLAYETLSTLKTYIDKKNCFYIIPCDDEAIKKHLKSSQMDNEAQDEFLKKIFDTYIRIPLVDVHDKDAFIETQLNRLKLSEELSPDDLSKMKQILFQALQNDTPRQIKRTINEICSYYEVAKEIDPDYKTLLSHFPSFIIMIAIKQKWTNFENILIEDPEFLKRYYTDSSFRSTINNPKTTKMDQSLIDFINAIEFYYNIDTNIKPFILLKDNNLEKNFKNNLISGNVLHVEDNSDEISIDSQAASLIKRGEYLDLILLSLFKTIIQGNNKNIQALLCKRFLDLLFSDRISTQNFIIRNIDNFGSLLFVLKQHKQYLIKIKNVIVDILTNNYANCTNEIKTGLLEILLKDNDFEDELIAKCINTQNIKDATLGVNIASLLSEYDKTNIIPQDVLVEFAQNLQINNCANEIAFLRKLRNFDAPYEVQSILFDKAFEFLARIYNSHSTNDLLTLSTLLLFVTDVKQLSNNNNNYKNFKANLRNFISRFGGTNYIELYCQYIKFISSEDEEGLLYNKIENIGITNLLEQIDSNCLSILWEKQRLQTNFLLSDKQDSLNVVINRFPDFINEHYLSFIIQNNQVNIINLRRIFIAIKDRKPNINLTIKDIGLYICQHIKEQTINTIIEIIKLFVEFEYKPLKKYFCNDKGFVNLIISNYYESFNVECIKQLQFITDSEDWISTYIVPIYRRIHDESVNQNKDVSSYSSSTSFITHDFAKTQEKLIGDLIKSLLIDTKSTNEHQFAIDIIEKLNEYKLFKASEYKEEFELVKNKLTGAQQDSLKEFGVNL